MEFAQFFGLGNDEYWKDVKPVLTWKNSFNCKNSTSNARPRTRLTLFRRNGIFGQSADN